MKVMTYEEWMEQNERLVKQQVALTKAQDSQGKTAYEMALGELGKTKEELPVKEWLDSLKGESAYQIAKRLGLTEAETEEEWINSLGGGGESGVGPAGKSAYEVYVEITSDDPVKTEQEWLESLEGKSAYEYAVEEGFVGDETAWLASLKGADGDDGKSAYEYATDGGFLGDEEEFNTYLSNIGDIHEVLDLIIVSYEEEGE